MSTKVGRFLCNDGNAEVEIEADSAQEAAQEYVDGADWGESDKTRWVNVYVKEIKRRADQERITIRLDPPEPECSGGNEHDWQSPLSLVGGIKENPGVQGHGGGVVIAEVCMRCGCARTTDTWAQDPETGEQGLRSVSYEAGKYAATPGGGRSHEQEQAYEAHSRGQRARGDHLHGPRHG